MRSASVAPPRTDGSTSMRNALVFLILACRLASGLGYALADDGRPQMNHAGPRLGLWPRRPVAASVQPTESVPKTVITAAAFQADPAPMPPEPIPSASAAPPSGISLEELQSIAVANNPTLAQAAARVDAARGRWIQAGLYPNPSIGYMADEIGMAGRAGAPSKPRKRSASGCTRPLT